MKFTLAGQGGWLAEGTGGSGLVKETFTDMGNQAYVGFFPPEKDDESYLNLWRPITVPKTGAKRLKFSVAMMIADTEKEQRDEFRWSIYNSETKRLASIDFDNHNQEINFELDDGEGFKETEFSFERNAIYDLSIEMDFEKNHWSAFIGGETIVDKQLSRPPEPNSSWVTSAPFGSSVRLANRATTTWCSTTTKSSKSRQTKSRHGLARIWL